MKPAVLYGKEAVNEIKALFVMKIFRNRWKLVHFKMVLLRGTKGTPRFLNCYYI